MIVNKYNQGGGGSGSGVTPQEVQQQINSALTPYWDSAVTESAITEAVSGLASEEYVQNALSGISLDGYYTSAQTDAAIAQAVSGKADAKIVIDFDHTSQAERASLYADLYALYDGGSGATINKLYDFYKTVNTWQGLKIDYYGFSGDTLVFGKVVSPENIEDQVVYEQVMTIDSEGNVEVVTNVVGGADMSAYWTSAQTEDAISAATSGKADAVSVTKNTGYKCFPMWNEQGIITGAYSTAWTPSYFYINGNRKEPLFARAQDIQGRQNIYAPESAGTAGDILVSTGQGAPVWSAVTFSGGGDMSAYWTSAETKTYVDDADDLIESAITEIQTALAGVSGVVQEQQIVFSSGYNELHTQVLEISGRPTPDMTQYTPTSGFATINGSAITNPGNIVIQGGGGGGISQADLASSGYLYYQDDGQNPIDTNLDDVYAFLKGNYGDGYAIDPPRLVDYDGYDGNTGTAPFPKHIVTIYQSDYDDLVNDGMEDEETFYIVLPDPE